MNRWLIWLILCIQGIYDLSLTGLARMTATAGQDSLQRLHAVYCHCQHCSDIHSCCCVPHKQVITEAAVRQCDPSPAAKVANTWAFRLVSQLPTEVPLCISSEEAGGYVPSYHDTFVLPPEPPPRGV